ncbi:hypothetical protein Y032_0011g1358 [Ancylostoma ceylanicum]|uniref:Uncharacterized protein n=1 Tax=Ancylostoma ceylanicum TaxID=53326 RepID=A0A016VE86_9BILA|nr:hypothetical protein Y032_0011g1358 [Ancylostoma ceylanicum]
MAAPQTAVAHEAGLKVTAVEVPSTDQNERRTRDGKWTLRQLRQTDAIVPLQSGTNQFDSQRVCLHRFSLEFVPESCQILKHSPA